MTMMINSLMLRKVRLIRSVWRPTLPWVPRQTPSALALGPPGHSAVTLSMSHRPLSTRERLGRQIYYHCHQTRECLWVHVQCSQSHVRTVVSCVSAHGHLDKLVISANMYAYPGYKLHTFVWKLQHWPLEIWYMGAYPGVGTCPGHYSTCTVIKLN